MISSRIFDRRLRVHTKKSTADVKLLALAGTNLSGGESVRATDIWRCDARQCTWTANAAVVE